MASATSPSIASLKSPCNPRRWRSGPTLSEAYRYRRRSALARSSTELRPRRCAHHQCTSPTGGPISAAAPQRETSRAGTPRRPRSARPAPGSRPGPEFATPSTSITSPRRRADRRRCAGWRSRQPLKEERIGGAVMRHWPLARQSDGVLVRVRAIAQTEEPAELIGRAPDRPAPCRRRWSRVRGRARRAGSWAAALRRA